MKVDEKGGQAVRKMVPEGVLCALEIQLYPLLPFLEPKNLHIEMAFVNIEDADEFLFHVAFVSVRGWGAECR